MLSLYYTFFLSECKNVLRSKVTILVNQQVHIHVQNIWELKREQTPNQNRTGYSQVIHTLANYPGSSKREAKI